MKMINRLSLKAFMVVLLGLCLCLSGCGADSSNDIKSEYLNLTGTAGSEEYQTAVSYVGDFVVDFSIDTRADFLRGREIYWEYSGDRYGEMKVQTGDIVEKGDVLMTVEVGVSEADLLARELSVSEAQSALSQIDINYSNRINQASSATAGLTGVDLQIAEANVDRIRAEYGERRAAAAYRLQVAEKSLKEMTDHQAKTEILAPYDGYILYVTRSFRTGDEISPNEVLIGIGDLTSRVVTLTNTNKTTNIPYLSTVKLIDQRDQAEYSGTVVSCGDVNSDGTDLVVIEPDIDLMSMALSGVIRVQGQLLSETNVVLVDSRAVRQEGMSRYVLVLTEGTLSKVYVTVGGTNQGISWITEGLSEGMTVILE